MAGAVRRVGGIKDQGEGGTRGVEAAAEGRESGEADWRAAGGREGGFVFAVPFLLGSIAGF